MGECLVVPTQGPKTIRIPSSTYHTWVGCQLPARGSLSWEEAGHSPSWPGCESEGGKASGRAEEKSPDPGWGTKMALDGSGIGAGQDYDWRGASGVAGEWG